MARKAAVATVSPPSSGAKKIDENVLDVLKRSTWKHVPAVGAALDLPEQLDREHYLKTIEVLKTYGGTWSKKHKTIMFGDEEDAETSVLEACRTGVYVDLKKVYQFFETPEPVAKRLLRDADMEGHLTVLEPSAGNGALICAIAAACAGSRDNFEVTAVELNPACKPRLEQLMGSDKQVLKKLVMGDFLNQEPEELGRFDRIIMNPPFARSMDLEFVRHAYRFLKPGGILVSVMSPGFRFRTDKRAEMFRDWLDNGPGKFVETQDLPDGSFIAFGTNVRTVCMKIKRYT